LDDLVWALGDVSSGDEPPRLLLTGTAAGLARTLRACGICCAIGPEQDPLAYAKVWRYTHWVSATANEAVVTSVPDLVEQRAPFDAAAVARVVVR
jgi:hypothetical protein